MCEMYKRSISHVKQPKYEHKSFSAEYIRSKTYQLQLQQLAGVFARPCVTKAIWFLYGSTYSEIIKGVMLF